MPTINDIVVEINRRLMSAYSTQTVYTNRCPEKFDRPSFLIEAIRINNDSANRKTVKTVAYFTITCIEPVDEYWNSDSAALLDVQEKVLQLFRAGYLKVGDRALKVSASTGGADFDRSYVDLQLEFYDDRGGEEEIAPPAENIETNFENKSN